jgi:hypothetical protein
MKNRVAVLGLLVAILAGLAASAGSTSLQGHFRCGFTDYMWPTSPEDAPTATGNGTMEFESDGNGKFIAGSMTEHVADDTRRLGEKVCTFQLVNGEYRMNSSSAGTSTIVWKLRAGSDSHCGAFLRNLNTANLGYTESPSDSAPVSRTGSFFILPDGSSKLFSASEIGVSIGACVPVH